MAKINRRFIEKRSSSGIGLNSPYSEDKKDESKPMPKKASGDYYGTGVRNPQGKSVPAKQ
jgi:hypothetical protein